MTVSELCFSLSLSLVSFPESCTFANKPNPNNRWMIVFLFPSEKGLGSEFDLRHPTGYCCLLRPIHRTTLMSAHLQLHYVNKDCELQVKPGVRFFVTYRYLNYLNVFVCVCECVPRNCNTMLGFFLRLTDCIADGTFLCAFFSVYILHRHDEWVRRAREAFEDVSKRKSNNNEKKKGPRKLTSIYRTARCCASYASMVLVEFSLGLGVFS